MSAADASELALLDALHDAIDGDFLVAAGRSVGNRDEDVPISEARVSEVVWWAVQAVLPVLAVERDRIRAEARREALEEAAELCWDHARPHDSRGFSSAGDALAHASRAIRALVEEADHG